MEMNMASDWAGIPDHLSTLIAERLSTIEDYLRFGAVCQSWHSVSTPNHSANLKNFPWLMLAEKEDMRGFYNPYSDKFFEISLPEIRGKRCWGSPFGWLIINGMDLKIHLFNPLSKACLSLPPQFSFSDQYHKRMSVNFLRNLFVFRLVLLSSPDSPNCVVMAIYGEFCFLAFAKPGDRFWTRIENNNYVAFDDVIYFNGKIFAVQATGDLFECQDLYGSQSHPVAVKFVPVPINEPSYRRYLVDLGGDLCMVLRSCYFNDDDEIASEGELKEQTFFDIFKLNMNKREWERVSSLGDRCLFVGNNSTFSIRASDYACSPNCIYFTDDELVSYPETGGSIFGIYNVETAEEETLPSSTDMIYSLFCPPLWITPRL